MTKTELTNRAKQGATAAVGTFAIMALSSYKAVHSSGRVPEFSVIAKFSLITALILGTTWACMPAAKEGPEETYEKLKSALYPIIALAVKRTLEEDKAPQKPQEQPQTATVGNTTYRNTSEYQNWRPKFRSEVSWNDDAYTPKYRL